MTWSALQRRMFVMAATKAGWNDDQRYAVMRYAGCPVDLAKKRPTVSATGNTNEHFRECMAIAESACRSLGVPLAPPREHASWDAACHDRRAREIAFVERMAAEAARRLPMVFDERLISAVVAHVARENDNPLLPGVRPERLAQCDGPTVHRVAECMRAWVGRRFAECGLKPESFHIPASARRRAERRSA